MTVKEAMSKLEALGNDKVRARNKKHGAGDNQFGLQMGDIRKIAAPIKTDHKLALELWETGNIDARFLATLIMVPKQMTIAGIEKLVGSIDFVYVADWFNNYVLKEFPQKEELREKWMKSKNPMIARAGWSLTSGRVAREPEGLDIAGLLDRIEMEMPKAKPEVQWTMNSTLANIGIKHAPHRKRAIAIGEKLGIYRDYPVSKGCTSPFAPIWIEAIVKRG